MLSRHIPRPYAVLPLSASYDVSFASPFTPFDIPIEIHSASHHTSFHRPNVFIFMSGPSASLLTSSFFRSAFLLCTVPRLLPFHSATHSIPRYAFIFMSGPVKFRVSLDFFIFRFRARILSRYFPRLVVSRSTYSFLPCPIPFRVLWCRSTSPSVPVDVSSRSVPRLIPSCLTSSFLCLIPFRIPQRVKRAVFNCISRVFSDKRVKTRYFFGEFNAFSRTKRGHPFSLSR
jgi:hypothetical protein